MQKPKSGRWRGWVNDEQTTPSAMFSKRFSSQLSSVLWGTQGKNHLAGNSYMWKQDQVNKDHLKCTSCKTNIYFSSYCLNSSLKHHNRQIGLTSVREIGPKTWNKEHVTHFYCSNSTERSMYDIPYLEFEPVLWLSLTLEF